MTWSLVLGGAQCVYDDLRAAIGQFGEPATVIAAKDIWVTYPRVDIVVSFHSERLEAECARRGALGLPMPSKGYIFTTAKPPVLPFETVPVYTQGGSSGLMATMIAYRLSDKVILAGVPNDPNMKHFHDNRGGKPWAAAENFKVHWLHDFNNLNGRVRSMSGWTRELLGYPTREWLAGPSLPRLPWPKFVPMAGGKSEPRNPGAEMAQLALRMLKR